MLASLLGSTSICFISLFVKYTKYTFCLVDQETQNETLKTIHVTKLPVPYYTSTPPTTVDYIGEQQNLSEINITCKMGVKR